MKKKDLEIFLEKVPNFPDPKINLEQYKTPAYIAADMLYQAFLKEDIQDKCVLDLGCGTGIFAVGASMLHAKNVKGFDIDEACILQAIQFAKDHQLDLSFTVTDIEDVDQKGDTAIMNPPFGAQKKNKHADRIFMKKALSLCPVVYSLHLEYTWPFMQKLIRALQANTMIVASYQFPIKGSYFFHKHLVSSVPIILLRTTRLDL
jgi:putative methylase